MRAPVMIESKNRNKCLTYVDENFWTANDASKRYKISQYLMHVVHPLTAQAAPSLLDLFRKLLVILKTQNALRK